MLRSYQETGLAKVLARPDKRHIFMWATSAGKTLAALKFMEKINAQSILVVCPALARGTWLHEFSKWASFYSPMAIRYGRDRTSGLSKSNREYRDRAYQSPIVVCSYRLLDHLASRKWDCIIIDEAHALRAPLSLQSKAVRKHFQNQPGLALSATAIPTDPKQLWNLLDMFWPNQWGPAQPTGDVSWKFQAMYCKKEINEYGTSYKGAKSDEAMELLARKLDPFVHRVSDTEVAPYLPPLHAEALRLDERRDYPELAVEWLDNLPENAISIVVCYLRETAADLSRRLECEFIDGTISPETRFTILQAAVGRKVPIVATSESIRESISLSEFTHALILEWRTSPGAAIQLLGRFARQDAKDLTRPTYVQYVCQPGDDAKADILNERIAAINRVQQHDRKADTLIELFKPEPLTDEKAEKMFAAMISSFISTNTEEESIDD